jgi:DNA primase
MRSFILTETLTYEKKSMNILDLLQDYSLTPKRKAACHGGEYCSPCPFCKDGHDRFLTWPNRRNNNGEHQGGRFSCRVCGKFGDAITFLRELHGLSYKEACSKLRIEPKQRINSSAPKSLLKRKAADEPNDLWKQKAKAFVEWSHDQLMNNQEGLGLLRTRGFRDDSIARFGLGYNQKTYFRECPDWGIPNEIKDDGKARKLWLPAGLVIPTFSCRGIAKIKIRRSKWKEGDKWPKYVEVSGSKQTTSVFGDVSLPCALVLESEFDALIIQQEAADLVYCIALGGSTKPLDNDTDLLLRKTKKILFLPDFDKAGAVAWSKWKRMFSNISYALTPDEKSAGDYFLAGGNLRAWIEDHISA